MKRFPVVVTSLAGLLLALAGCASRAPGTAPGTAGAPAPSGTVTVAPPTSSPESPMPSLSYQPKPSVPASGEVTVTGTVEAGVERGCVVLRAGVTLYQLVGQDPAIVEGAHVTVRGRPDPTLLTTCQQGTPLHVIEVTPGR